MWMPSRAVAKVGIDALEHDRGSVIPGLASQVSTRLFGLLPQRVLMPLLVKQHPALRSN
jgi:short-subunit dehydrogenase